MLLVPAGILALTACAEPSGSASASGAADLTGAAGIGDVQPFTTADAPSAYGARVRVSFAGGATSESTESTSRSVTTSPSGTP